MRSFLVAVSMTAFAMAEPAAVDFPFDWSLAGESRIDLSRFLDGSAGKAGHLRAEGEKFVTGDGKEMRFWGVNMAIEACFPDEEKAPEIADQLARWGINLVRFHHIDTDWGKSFIDGTKNDTRHLDAANVAKFDRLFAELKKRGIWTVLTLNIHRKYKEGDGVRDWELLGIGKGATYFNPKLIELQHEFSRKVLEHVNPHTGLSYAADPAVMGIELLNENSLLEAWAGWRLKPGVTEKQDDTWQPVPASYAAELDGLYYDWLVEKGTPEQRAAVTKETGISFETKPAVIPTSIRLTPDRFKEAGEIRFRVEVDFLMEIEAKFFDSYKHLIRDELGSKALLTLSNDHNDGISGYPHLKGNMRGDWVDGHGYWEHPSIGERTSTNNTPMVNVPLNSTVVQFARSVPEGKSFTIGEVNHPFPHRYAAEGFPILTAYSMFQGWDGIAWFNWRQSIGDGPADGVGKYGWFDIGVDSVKLAQMLACGLMWHRHDVAEAATTHVRNYGEIETKDSLRMEGGRPFFKEGFDLTLPLREKVRFTFAEGEADLDPAGGPTQIYAKPPSVIDSEGGQLSWSHADEGSGVVRIDTARTSGLIGFVKKHFWEKSATTRHLKAEIENDHASVILTSLDDKPLAGSGSMLLVAVCRSANTGQAWEDDWKTLAQWGTGPLRITPVAGKVILKNLDDVKGITVWSLSAEGRRTEERSLAQKTEEGWQVNLDTPATMWEVEVGR